MKKKILVLFLLHGLFCHFLFSQKKTFIGIFCEANFDNFKIQNKTNYLKLLPSVSGAYGFNLEQTLNDQIAIEIGLKRKYHLQRISTTLTANGFTIVNFFNSDLVTHQVSLRLKRTLKLNHNKILLKPSIGYTFGINNTIQKYFGGGGIGIPQKDILEYNFAENSNLVKYFSLFELGVGLDYALSNNLSFVMSGNWLFGFREIANVEYKFLKNKQLTETNKIKTNGGYYSIALGFKYNIARFFPAKRRKIKSIKDYYKVENK